MIGEEHRLLASQFENNRTHLRAVAFRMLGSVGEAEDAVQEAWLRLSRARSAEVQDLTAWLTTVVARVCLDMLRVRTARREQPFGPHVSDPIVDPAAGVDPEHEALLADSVGLALLVVLGDAGAAGAAGVRAARHVRRPIRRDRADRRPLADGGASAREPGAQARPGPGARTRRRSGRAARVVGAFLAAARGGDLDALVALLDPGVVARIDRGRRSRGGLELEGARAVAEQVLAGGARFAGLARPVLVNGSAGVLVAARGRPLAVAGFTVVGGRIARVDVVADPARLRRLDLSIPE